MKKLFTFLLLCTIGTGMGFSQCEFYRFTEKQGSYTALSGNDVKTYSVPDGRLLDFILLNNNTITPFPSKDSSVTEAIPIGFDFVFNDTIYDKFVISSNGFIILGKKGENHVDISGVSEAGNAVMTNRAIGMAGEGDFDCLATEGTHISYLSGQKGDVKTLAVEFSRISYSYFEPTVFTHTVTLSQDSSIGFSFGDMLAGSGNRYLKFGIGLKNTDNNLHFRAPEKNNDWTITEAVKRTNNAYIMRKKLPKGTEWKFIYPKDCAKPENTDIEIDFNRIYSDNFRVSVSSQNPTFDGAMMFITDQKLTETPEDGTEYDYYFGDYSLFENGAMPSSGWTYDGYEEWDEYEPNTTQYVYVYPYNNACKGGIHYGAVILDSCVTKTTAPQGLSITKCNKDVIELKVEKNSLHQDVAIVSTNKIGLIENINCGLIGTFGFPENNLKVGDTLFTEQGEFGGVVIYTGNGEGNISLTGIQPNLLYHFAAYSKDAQGRYSTFFAQADTISPAAFPFEENFKEQPCGTKPYGWEGTEVFEKYKGQNYVNAYLSAEANLTTPEFLCPEKNLRMVLDYYMWYKSNRIEYGFTPNLWGETDSILIEASLNGGEFKTIAAIHKFNADDFGPKVFRVRNIPIKGLAAGAYRFRVRFVTNFEQGVTVYVRSVRIIEEPVCDYPSFVQVHDSTIIGSSASVSWIPGTSEESVWNVAYAKITGSDEPDWSEPIEVSSTKLKLSALEAKATYQARVQAVCGIGNRSEWTYSENFVIGDIIPMKEDFNNLPTNSRRRKQLNANWMEKSSALTDTVRLQSISDMAGTDRFRLCEWKYANEDANDGVNGSLLYRPHYKSSSWLILPALDFEQGNEGTLLSFDISVTDAYGNSVDSVGKSTKLYIFYSSDNGDTYYAKDSIATFDYKKLHAFGDSTRVMISLDRLTGNQRLAFFFYSQTDNKDESVIFIDNIEVYSTCASPKDLRYHDLKNTSVSLSWRADPRIDKWIVKQQSRDGQHLMSVAENHLVLESLKEATHYTLSVSHLCNTDTASWASVEFTTGGIRCDEITDPISSQITKNSALLGWKGNAASYRVQIRKKDDADNTWNTYTTEETSYSVGNLLPATTYIWRVQSVCGEAIGDTSAYSQNVEFTTLAISCFPPEDFQLASINYYSALLKWKGNNGTGFQISYKKETESAYSHYAFTNQDSLRISPLEPEKSYNFRIRSICSAGDTSQWSNVISGTTSAIPPCEQPSELTSEAITTTSAQLSWKVEGNISCILRVRPSASTIWDSIEDLTETTYLLKNLEPNTAYSWSVMSLCDNNRCSGWAKQASFNTSNVGNERLLDDSFRLHASFGQLHILNPNQLPIERIEIFEYTGRLLQSHPIRNTENVVIPTTLRNEVVIVRILTANGKTSVHKIRM